MDDGPDTDDLDETGVLAAVEELADICDELLRVVDQTIALIDELDPLNPAASPRNRGITIH